MQSPFSRRTDEMATTRQKSGLTKKGSAVKGAFSKRYGKTAGPRVFYATLNANPKMMKALVKPSRRKK
jgi:hypothetical protein